jgi:hypothetical protein
MGMGAISGRQRKSHHQAFGVVFTGTADLWGGSWLIIFLGA